MARRVLLIDVDKFTKAMDQLVQSENELSGALNGKDNFMAIYHGAVAKAMHNITKTMITTGVVEKWD